MRRGAEGAIVFSALRFVGQHAVRLGQGGGPSGRHLLELLAEMMNFVRMVKRDLRAERALDLLGRRRGSDLQHVVMVFRHHIGLLLEFGDVGGRELAPSFATLALLAFAQTLRLLHVDRAARAVRAEIPAGLQHTAAVRTAAAQLASRTQGTR